MANEEHLAILKKGVEAWNDWRVLNNPVVDLSGADLSGLDLSSVDVFTHVDLHAAMLTNAFMVETDLGGASLVNADLTGANLKGASLAGANMWGVFLDRACLADTILYDTDFSEAHIEDTDFSNSVMDGKIFVDVDLSRAKGLDRVRHEGPCKIGIETIYMSEGRIPVPFLHGAGVPESFIVYMKSLVVEPIEYYSCFISYSSKDQEFAERLYADLQSKNVRCWFAQEDMKVGDRIRPTIDEAIRVHDKLLLVLAENSVKSAWVEKEVETAFEKERKQGRTVLFPIRLDDAVMEAEEAWAADIRRTRHIGDFRQWRDHDKYKKAFERLMRDLKA